MKKIIVLILTVALCMSALTSCKVINKVLNKGEPETTPLDEVASMYNMSAPTKITAVTKQTISATTLTCEYELVTGAVDGKAASVYTVKTQEFNTVENGGATDIVKPLINETIKKTEAIEGVGSRVNGSEWNPEGTIWIIGRGAMGLNLDNDSVTNVTYENHVLTFTVPKANASVVLGEAYSKNIDSDVSVTIVDDGAVVTAINLSYLLAGDEAAKLPQSEMKIEVVYTYDIEKITIS